ncbi:hypothetical protein [Marinobacter qingdaonensis]|uniref:Carboxypeptidase regulatory-like domain-containing protein n=1 Tax=Marinobacter qingdaonensis TaxID=3108486 RepID=A0ABU5NUW5_9GAMM|nr:hypothetical protein [Marinobacter sp. ASW11-75]MEA1079532.1 hypothetical protein [Marinobacter sp. ASW11-75]
MSAVAFYRDQELAERIYSQIFLSADPKVTSLEVIDGVGLPSAGVTIDGTGDTVSISFSGGSASTQVTADGEYVLDVSPGVFCVVKVTDYANLGATSSQMTGGFGSVKNALFSDITAQEATDGDVETKSLYVKNIGDAINEFRLYLTPSNSGESYRIDGAAHNSVESAKVVTNFAAGEVRSFSINRIVDSNKALTATSLTSAEICYEAHYASAAVASSKQTFSFSVESRIYEIDPGFEKRVTYHCVITTEVSDIEIPLQSFSSRSRVDLVGYEVPSFFVFGKDASARAEEIQSDIDSGRIKGAPIYKQITNLSLQSPAFHQLSKLAEDQLVRIYRRVLLFSGATNETEICRGLISQIQINENPSSSSLQIAAVEEIDAPETQRNSKLPAVISASGTLGGGLTIRMMPHDMRPTDRVYYRATSYEVEQVALIVNESSSSMELRCG